MSDVESCNDKREKEHSTSRKYRTPDDLHSYWIGLSKGIYQRRISYREELLCNRVLQLITHACRADHAALIVTDYSFLYDEIDRIHVCPEPASEEEMKLWKYVAAYIGESVRLGTPLNMPDSLWDALNLDVLISPTFSHDEGASVVAIFNKSSSPPLNHEDEKILHRLTDEFMHIFTQQSSPETRVPSHVRFQGA